MNALTSIDKGTLSYLEWRVVEMARDDGPRSCNPDARLARLARLIGMYVPNRLANEKLESLRRFSVRAWYWDLIRTKDIRAFLDAGYSRTQILDILSHVGLARGFTPTLEYDSVSSSLRDGSSPCRCG